VQVLPLDMVDKSIHPFQTHFGLVFCHEAVQTSLLFPERGSIGVLLLADSPHPSPRNMALHSHLALVPLKRKPAARGKRAPPAPSIVGLFSQLPSPAYAGGLVAPIVCPLVLESA
jgi:hypothetical protein